MYFGILGSPGAHPPRIPRLLNLGGSQYYTHFEVIGVDVQGSTVLTPQICSKEQKR